jgi:hypothetical protein
LNPKSDAQKAELETQKRVSNRLVDLIDVVFGVVVAINFGMLFSSNPFGKTLTLEQVLSLPNFSLVVAYIAIILSWVGYHQMIEYNPYILNRWGYFRFSFDVMIVFMYTVLMYSVKETTLYLLVYPMIFLLYAIGGATRDKEYARKVSWSIGSIEYTLFFSFSLLFWVMWEFLRTLYSKLDMIPMAWILVIVALILNLHYRYKRAKKGFIRRDE